MIKEDQFLSHIFNQPCGKSEINDALTSQEIEKYKFVYCKSNFCPSICKKASELNFYLVQISVILGIEIKTKESLNQQYEFANYKDLEEIKAIASNAFIFDRFNQDPNINKDIASKIKIEWVSNYFKGERGDNCFVIRSKENIIKGFLITIKDINKVRIDLIAVNKAFRNQGIGKELIKSMFYFYENKNFIVETQLINLPSLSLYETMGFRVLKHELVWHYLA